MRNASRFLAVVVVAVALIAAATPASAGCSPPKFASTFTGNIANYVYLDLGTGTTAAQVVGSFYDLAGNNNGGYPASQWLFVDVSGKLSMQANLGDARVVGCPSGKLILRAQASTPTGVKFLTMTTNEGERSNATGADFDFSFGKAPGTIIASSTIPRPRVNSSGRVGGVVNLDLAIDATNGGNSAGDSSSAVTAYEIVRASGADPGRNADGWTVVQTVPTTGGGAVPSVLQAADCSNTAVDQFFATRLVFGTSKSELVSDSTRVNCNPTLAEPRFNVVPKKPTGPKRTGARQ